MEDNLEKLDYESFRQKAFESLQDSLRLLRDVKYHYAKCCERCYSTDSMPDRCMTQCNTMHDQHFNLFNSLYQPSTVAIT